MYVFKTIVLLACLTLTLAAVADANQLENRHQIGLQLGVWNQVADVRTEIGIGGMTSSVGSSGFLGGLKYGYNFSEHLALNIDIGVMRAKVEAKFGFLRSSSTAASVTHLLVKAKWYLPSVTGKSSMRPYLSAGVGPFVGSQAELLLGQTLVEKATTETVLGGQIGGGVDFITGRHFMTGVSV
ncbi:MAG: outer membrane beta-barrel protein, partial [candidate division Zixibacteria bacterium]|nr:outer membrane beta-barrel protein [candidate division Zixibacteria bacterium]